MTPEERAEAVLRGWYGRYMNLDQRRADLAAAVREAIAAERERCLIAVTDAIADWLSAPQILSLRDVRALFDRAETRIRKGGAA